MQVKFGARVCRASVGGLERGCVWGMDANVAMEDVSVSTTGLQGHGKST